MSRHQKRLTRLLGGEVTGWRYHELAAILEAEGYHVCGSGTSHRSWKHPLHPDVLTLVDGPGEVARTYVRQTRKHVQRVKDAQEVK